MTFVQNCQLTVDRFGTPNSALAITSGYASVPSGIYFDPSTGGFTLMVWVKLLAILNAQKITDFGNGDKYSYTSDHSKYAISTTGYIVCLGDINRMAT